MSVRSLWSLAVLSLAVAFGVALDARAHSGTLVEGTLYNVHGDQNPRTGNQAVREYYVHSADDGHFVPEWT